MSKYRLGLYKKRETDGGNKRMKYATKNLIMAVKWFDSSRFKFASKSGKKAIVKQVLKNTRKEEIRFQKKIKKTERIIVNRKGAYGFDNAVFDDVIKMPKHLRGGPVNG